MGLRPTRLVPEPRWHASQPPPQREIEGTHPRSDGQGRLRRQVGKAYSYVAVDDDEAGRRREKRGQALNLTGGGQFGHLVARGKKNLACASAERERGDSTWSVRGACQDDAGQDLALHRWA